MFERFPVSPLILALVYFVWPLDLIPDLFGPLGRIDDILVLLLAGWRIYVMKKARVKPAAETSEAEQKPDEAPRDPFEVLGLQKGASRDDIEARYRELAKKYHPDRVAHLGEEFHGIAHEKMVEIQRAYAKLTANI